MKYWGRIGLLLVVLAGAAGFNCYSWMKHDDFNPMAGIALGVYLCLAWWLGKKYDKAKYHSDRDALTELYNRRYALEMFPKMKKLSEKRLEKLVVLFFDVDNFKTINDHYNHEAGDLVLKQISEHLTDTFRGGCCKVRWGGDEFVVLLPLKDEAFVNTLLYRFKSKLRTLPIQSFIEISVSVGYAVYPQDGDNLSDLIRHADKKMYVQKQNKAQ